MTLVDTDDLALLLKRDLTDEESDAATLIVELMTAELEEFCGRPISPRTIIGERASIGPTGQVFLKATPVISIDAVTYAGSSTPYSGAYGLSSSFLTFSPNSIPTDVTVSYTAGLEPPANAGLRSIMLGRLSRIAAKVHDDALGVSSLSQEGYNAAYLAEGWTEQELKIAERRRRRVVRVGGL